MSLHFIQVNWGKHYRWKSKGNRLETLKVKGLTAVSKHSHTVHQHVYLCEGQCTLSNRQAQILSRKCIWRTLGSWSQPSAGDRACWGCKHFAVQKGPVPPTPQLTMTKGLFPAHKQGGRLREEAQNREEKELPCLENSNSSSKIPGALLRWTAQGHQQIFVPK